MNVGAKEPWTQDELTQLDDLFDQGYSLNEIAKELGRSYMAVRYKVIKRNNMSQQQPQPPPHIVEDNISKDMDDSLVFVSGMALGALVSSGLIVYVNILLKSIAIVA